jgi:hypothetical protein
MAVTNVIIPTTKKEEVAKKKKGQINKPVEQFSDNFALDRKIKDACTGIKPAIQRLLMELPRDEDKEVTADYILQWTIDYDNGQSMSPNTKVDASLA